MARITKQPGADWDVFYMLLDGTRESMTVFGQATPEDAIAEARWSLNAFCDNEAEKDQFEILAVVRCEAGIEVRAPPSADVPPARE